MYTYIYICIYMYTYVFMHACMCMCICNHTGERYIKTLIILFVLSASPLPP